MRRCTQKERYAFIRLIEDHAALDKRFTLTSSKPIITRVAFAERLLRYGATLGRIAENQCNGYQDWRGDWDQKAADREERKEQRIRVKVEELCAQFGCKPMFQGDPRGNTLKIQVPDGYTNDWGREGICVPTS